jgi:hypothetical protein
MHSKGANKSSQVVRTGVADGMGGGGEWMVKILVEDTAEMEGKRVAHVTRVSVSARRA